MLKSERQSHVEQTLNSVRQSPHSLLLLDYDGTLAPFRTQRDQAIPYPGVAALLHEIVRTGRTRVVIVSGREATEIIPLLGIEPAPEVWGLHGLQRRKTNGSAQMAQLDEQSLNALLDADRWLTSQQLRHHAEYKTGSIALHWRGLGDRETENLRDRVLLGWKRIADHAHLDLLDFDGGVEIRVPAPDKGDVVRVLLSEVGPDAPTAFLGDDATDERAFEALQGRGLSVLVRPRWRRTAAQVWLKPPEELLDFLTRWLAACRGRSTMNQRNVEEMKA